MRSNCLFCVHVPSVASFKMAEILLGERKLTDLKVTELKAELDKRGLPKKGVKSVLVERLKKAILKEELSNVSVAPLTPPWGKGRAGRSSLRWTVRRVRS